MYVIDFVFALSRWELLGVLGALIYVISFALAALDMVPSNAPLYYLLKLAAASLVLISLSESFNLAAAIIQVFFIAISVIGLMRHAHHIGRRRSGLPQHF